MRVRKVLVVPAAAAVVAIGALAVVGCGGSNDNGETTQASENAAVTSKSGNSMKDESTMHGEGSMKEESGDSMTEGEGAMKDNSSGAMKDNSSGAMKEGEGAMKQEGSSSGGDHMGG